MPPAKSKTTAEPNTPAAPPTPFPTAMQMQRASHQRDAAGDRTMAAVKERLIIAEQENTEYTTAVHAVAAGEQLDPDEVAATVVAAARTMEQFTADVEARRRRIDLAAIAARRPAAEMELQKAQFEARDLEDEHTRLVKEGEARLIAAYGRRQRAADAVSDAMGAEIKLQRSYSGPLVKVMNTAQAKADAITRRINSLTYQRNEAQARLNTAADSPEKYPAGEADRQRAKVVDLNEQIKAAVREQEAAVNELNAAAFGMREL